MDQKFAIGDRPTSKLLLYISFFNFR